MSRSPRERSTTVLLPKASASSRPDVLPHPPGVEVMGALAVCDALVIAGMFVLAQWLREPLVLSQAWPKVAAWAGIVTGVALPVFGLSGLYDPRVACRTWIQAVRLMRAWALLLALSLLAVFLVKAGSPLDSRLAWGLFLGLGLLATTGLRLGVCRPWLRARYGDLLRGARVIVGRGSLAQRIAASRTKGFSPRVVGYVEEAADLAKQFNDNGLDPMSVPYLGTVDEVRRLAQERRISQVLVARDDLTRGRLVELAHQWLGEGVRVTLASTVFEVMVARASGGLLGGVPVVELQRSPQRGWRLRAKRLIDVTAVVLGGPIVLPLVAVVAAAIRIGTPGPILYRQTRIGKQGRPFTLYKFRSMVVDNDDGAHRRYVTSLMRGESAEAGENGETVYKLVDDPRVTPLGAVLRRFSLDELPQLWNVLRGDMSLVGPRPCLPYEWDLYEGWQEHRLDVLPGITGLWQVCGRSQVTFEEMVLLDLHYIANWSVGLDLLLLGKTLPVVVSGEGGH